MGEASRRRSRITAQSGAVAAGYQIFELRAHRVRDPAQKDDGDIALAAFELRDIALRDAGDRRQNFARHAAQRPQVRTRGRARQEAGFGCAARSFPSTNLSMRGTIVPMQIDSKQSVP